MKIWLLQTGEPLHVDAGSPRPMRAMNLADTLVARGHRVVLWSADFDHINKRSRNRAGESIEIGTNLEIRLLPSPGYRRNIGVGRLVDHAVLGWQLRKRLKQEPGLPDVAFVGYPPIETAYVMTLWLRERGVPVVLDVKDQWPVIFSAALPRPLRPLGKLLFYPYARLARQAMRSASAISAMADGFVDWALDYAGRARTDLDRAHPLTARTGDVTEPELQRAADWWDRNGPGEAGSRWIYFVGSFSSAFDFAPVAAAARAAGAAGDRLQFVLCGDGGSIGEVRSMMAGCDNVLFPGWIDRPKIEALAGRCIASIAPYRDTPDFRLSVPNKVVDSLALGLPVLTPLGGEVADLIEQHRVGIRYAGRGEEGVPDLYRAIRSLLDDPARQAEISANARNLYVARFAFDKVYGELADLLEQLARAPRAADADKAIEHDRYEQRAREALRAERNADAAVDAQAALPAALRPPYEAYAAEIDKAIDRADMTLLEIGAGTGMYTESILQTGARVVATDISESSLAILQRRLAGFTNLETRAADMEALPFGDAEFDLVCSAGSLSYGDNDVVMREIYRVLKPGGRFVCVDSLDHNPVYRLNRWIQYRRGRRTRSTIERMPTQSLVRRYGEKFGRVRAKYFGSITWAVPVLKIFLGDTTAARFSARIDRLVRVSKSAFKLVMVAEKIP